MELALTSKVQLYLTSAQVTLFQQITGGYRHVYKWVSTIAAATFCLQQAAPPFRDLPSLAGADGLTIEVHPDRKKALSDANQQLSPEEFDRLMRRILKLRDIVA